MSSLSLFVGGKKCNANCSHCAGVPLRKYSNLEDGEINPLIYNVVKESYLKGAKSLSLTGSGEPTLYPLSVTKVLSYVKDLEEVNFSPINLYSNGIRIGGDEKFSKDYLPLWKSLGLDRFYVTVHDLDEKKNAKIYGVSHYPSLDLVVSRIHDASLAVRANVVLSKGNIDSFEKYVSLVEGLLDKGFDSVSAWPVRDLNDKVDKESSPLVFELDKMSEWSDCRDNVRLLREKDKIVYETGQKFTLFPNGVLSNSWCN